MHEPYLFDQFFLFMAQLGPVMMFWFLVLPALVVLVLLVLLYRLLRTRDGAPAGRDDEARMMQEMYRSLSRMEERVEALETLLLDAGANDRPESSGRRGDARGTGRD